MEGKRKGLFACLSLDGYQRARELRRIGNESFHVCVVVVKHIESFRPEL
jgi:hypothetical protein